MSTKQIVLLLVPLALIYVALIVVAVVDWARRARFRLLPRVAWLAVIVLVGTIGPILYLVLGRSDEPAGGDESDK
jgi:uncharacterized membrane protein YqjE